MLCDFGECTSQTVSLTILDKVIGEILSHNNAQTQESEIQKVYWKVEEKGKETPQLRRYLVHD